MAESRLCTVPGCGKPLEAKGYCSMHYCRVRKTGSTDKRPRDWQPQSVIAWMRDHASHTGDECLAWPFGGRVGSGGYGSLMFRGSQMKASRAMCMMAHGEPPLGLHYAAHSCGNGHDA